MSSSNELQTVDMVEFGRHLVTKEPASAAWGNSPGLDVLGVTPDQIAESTFMGNLLCTSHNTNLVDCTNLRAQASVDAEDFTIDDGRKDKEVEDLAARLPNGRVAILLLTLLVETVDLSDLAGLVVTTNEGDLLRVPR